ncbi:MAG: monofunctional biosynthetic peptidoglycan transglycosylase [Ignavibacteriales bacterium]|nr:monofunctional biosynthetic peptidoglycan transglycosylase [Ignavibacteriales bacterium]
MARYEWIQRIWKVSFAWVRRHKFLTLIFILTGWIVLEIVTLPFGDVRRLKTANPGETAFMREHEQQAIAEGKHFKKIQRWIAFSAIPKDAINAVIVSEDGTFWSHSGFDWFEFRESIERNMKEGRAARGASTITQQLVKNLYLSSSKNPLRKLKEWMLTWYIERTLSKQRILELYLNVIEWGWGIYGIEAASQKYFGKSASLLSREESARLAAVIPNPRRLKVDRETPYLERRSQLILSRMAAQGL